ncbi:preprotein translocase subunit SecG [Paracoccus sediminis]|uniref:Protein-export membrane protein SecG n=1 Tax=Paracoccus sediminis TaxID=1214787 RepID=A0A238X9G4_9RHOB|nr:preprotein translocase subunit SecG [Paracoccus sediminis]TBN48937.1 preprotein translocase subunit SecG [Paracoccus sediminis]SNR55248.1 protein translocase subunit secG [Paracoccus sediminis]
MENVVLTIHLILAVLLTGVVLLQRSEGGGLGMGGGGGVMTGRQAANALTRLTWIFGIALFVTSIALTIIAARQVSNSSIMDQLGVPAGRQESTLPQAPVYVPPPTTGTAGDPLTPPAPDAPGTAAPQTGAAVPDTPATDTATQPSAPAAGAPADEPATPPADTAPSGTATPAPAN